MEDYIQYVESTTNATNPERRRRMWVLERKGGNGDAWKQQAIVKGR
jgi:hypothetical protein